MPCWSHRSETGVCSRRWSRSMATFSGTLKRLRVFLDMGKPALEIVAYSSALFFPFRLKQNSETCTTVGRNPPFRTKSSTPYLTGDHKDHAWCRWSITILRNISPLRKLAAWLLVRLGSFRDSRQCEAKVKWMVIILDDSVVWY